MIDDGTGFHLVPWQPVLDNRVGQHVTGTTRDAGVQIVTLAEGEISELHVGLKGTMNALFLKDLAAKTHRGLRGRWKRARRAAGSAMATRW